MFSVRSITQQEEILSEGLTSPNKLSLIFSLNSEFDADLIARVIEAPSKTTRTVFLSPFVRKRGMFRDLGFEADCPLCVDQQGYELIVAFDKELSEWIKDFESRKYIYYRWCSEPTVQKVIVFVN